jgi:uncharacterized RDD family membrane protein YckC
MITATGAGPVSDTRRIGAGIVSRTMAAVVDIFTVVLIAVALLLGYATVRALFTGNLEVSVPSPPVGPILGLLLLAGYFTHGWTAGGRTLGNLLLGLRAVRADGGDLTIVRAIARAVAYWLFLPGYLWIIVSGRNASLQDLVVGTSVIYDRGTRPHPH